MLNDKLGQISLNRVKRKKRQTNKNETALIIMTEIKNLEE